MTGADMKAMRQLLGLTQAQLAQELGVVEQTIWLYEAGRLKVTTPRAQQMARLAEREKIVLETREPCPTCHGTGWIPLHGPPRPMLDLDEIPLADTGLAQPEVSPDLDIPARGPGRPRKAPTPHNTHTGDEHHAGDVSYSDRPYHARSPRPAGGL